MGKKHSEIWWAGFTDGKLRGGIDFIILHRRKGDASRYCEDVRKVSIQELPAKKKPTTRKGRKSK